MDRRTKIFLGWVAAACLATASGAATLDEVEACLKSNSPKETSVQTITLEAVGRTGTANVSKATIHWKKLGDEKSGALIHFTAPAQLRGSAALFLEKEGRNDMFMYLPELGKVRRVTGRMMGGSLFGTDFAYEDFERLQGLEERGERALLPDAQLGTRKAYVIEERFSEESESTYRLVRTHIDQETCVPLQVEGFETKDVVSKIMTIDPEAVRKIGEIYVPLSIRAESPSEQTYTVLTIDDIELEVDIPRKKFSKSELERLGR